MTKQRECPAIRPSLARERVFTQGGSAVFLLGHVGGPWESPGWQVPPAPRFLLQSHVCTCCLCKAPGITMKHPLKQWAHSQQAERALPRDGLSGQILWPSGPQRGHGPLLLQSRRPFSLGSCQKLKTGGHTRGLPGRAPFSGKVGKPPQQRPELRHLPHTTQFKFNVSVYCSYMGFLGPRVP